ncbi:E3 ubiquitin ligase BIG BROTHER-related isoform X2 [Andrographis paniculata]|nr:E3 ubiquitin ligase BIG BROTHER-related isoform X2 [Andrographis paniculata]
MEDIETTSPDMHQISVPAPRRRYSSSESIESMLSQQFSQAITLARQNQAIGSEHNYQSVGEVAADLAQQSSSHTTPLGSRRFRRVFSDYDSDGFDSLYGESESLVSFRRSRILCGEADSISYSVYEGGSEASGDGQSMFEDENFGLPNGGGSDLETDTDIDPMNVGLYHWNTEDEEEEDEDVDEDNSEQEGTEVEMNVGLSRLNSRDVPIPARRQSLSPEVEGAFSLGVVHGRIQRHADALSAGIEELVARNHTGDSVDYLEGFENLLEQLSEAENGWRGGPPASESFVNGMPCLTVNEDKLDGMICAICKDPFSVGTVVKQLPCSHLYHPSCIYPWLKARNTCPLCRYELPTDPSYEGRSRDWGGNEYRRLGAGQGQHDVRQSGSLEGEGVGEPFQLGPADSDSEGAAAAAAARDIPRSGWLFAAAAAPFVGILGMSLMMWFCAKKRCQRSHIPCRRDYGQRWWRLYF